jgi:hypothetical protein
MGKETVGQIESKADVYLSEFLRIEDVNCEHGKGFKTKKPPEGGFCSGEQDRTADLRVMNPAL